MKRAVFLDRDGTLIADPGYLSRPEDVRALPGVPAALRRLSEAGLLLIVVTNQSGIGRGYFTENDYARVTETVREALAVPLDGVYHCPHAPDRKCSCRKPAPGMLLRAAREHGVDLAGSTMVGDAECDVLAGLAAGTRAILLGDGPAPEGARTARDLADAADHVLREAS